MKKRIIIPILGFIFIGILVTIFLVQTSKLSHALEEDQLSVLNLTELEDGSYTGAYESTLVSAHVEVDITNHKIVNINVIRHDTMFGKEAENITDDIIDAQSLDVDDITGATYSSEVIKRAIEDALAHN